MCRRVFAAILWLFMVNASYVNAETQTLDDAVKAINANVLFMRHALAPGFGDPESFSVKECATQRNLSDQGKDQASRIGAALKQAGFAFDDVLSSEWCRCKETARLLDLGDVQTFSGLNSFFQSHTPKEETLDILRRKLDGLSEDTFTLMVTHQVVIKAITSNSVSSGGLVAYNTFTQQAVSASID